MSIWGGLSTPLDISMGAVRPKSVFSLPIDPDSGGVKALGGDLAWSSEGSERPTVVGTGAL